MTKKKGNKTNEDTVSQASQDAHTYDREVRKRRKMKNGAVLMAGFLFWINFVGVLLLLIGFVAPGWLTAKTDQKFYYHSYERKTAKHIYSVYQDYTLWYVTQCYEHDDRITTCESMTYRMIDGVYGERYSDFEKYEIGSMEFDGSDRFMFNGAGLVFSFSQIEWAQTLYTVGLIIAMFTLYKWYQFRADVAGNKRTNISKKKWVLLLILTVLSTVFVLVPAIMFVLVRGNLGTDDYKAKVHKSLGSVLAGLGGGFMALLDITVFLHLMICNRKQDAILCNCMDKSEESAV